MKQTCKLSEWEQLHPNYQNDPKLLQEWQQMLGSMTDDPINPQTDKVRKELKKSIAEHIQIKDAMEKK